VFPPGIAAGLALAAGVLATGAMHEDGFADACDGFGGGNSRQRILEIMQDSRIGAFGAIGIVLALGLKWQALASMLAVYVPAALIACHSISRGMAATLMASLDYARREGPAKSRALAVRLGGVRLAFVVVTAVVPIVLLPLRAWWVLGALAIARWAAVRYFRNRIGGYTGDCLGAAQQVAELLCLLVFLGVG
jgi:adenosylcobinamide-GDP ribazoletransferase